MIFGFCGPSYTLPSSAIADEECINRYLETVETPNAETKWAMLDAPGYAVFATLPESPVRGSCKINSRTFAIGGSKLCELNSDGTFTVRKESFGIGVERVFPLHSPRIVKVERVKQSKVRRSKLYYMRDLSGKNARLKDMNRDYKMWEEKGAEEELEKIEAQVAAAAEKEAAKKAAEDAELAAKAEALAGDRIVEEDKK